MPEIQRGVSKGLMHKNTASRKLSRLSNKIKSINLINFQPKNLKILLANFNCRYAARLNSCTPS